MRSGKKRGEEVSFGEILKVCPSSLSPPGFRDVVEEVRSLHGA